jgi:type II secretory pathway pseudopilin PulG
MTLVELLVVLIILGILGAVTLRAMDVTRERSNYEKTMKTMERLSQAIVGNTSLVAEGRRTDFGFVGDMARLPTTMDELRENTASNPAWNGPYVRIPFEGDELSFKTDAWGQELQYVRTDGLIISMANGVTPLTYQIGDTTPLFRNTVSGTVTDNQGNPPGDQAPNLRVSLWVQDPSTGQTVRYDTVPRADGGFAFAPPRFRVPVGNHQFRVVLSAGGGESLTKWIQVVPRAGSNTIVDTRLNTSLAGALRLINGSAAVYPPLTSDNVSFEVINTGNRTVVLDTIWFFHSPDRVFCESLKLYQTLQWDRHGGYRAGISDTMPLTSGDSVPAMARMRVDLRTFRTTRNPSYDTLVDMHGRSFRLKFDDGSIVTVLAP